MGYLKYKGYTGSVEYSEEDKCLFGKVLGMEKDHITFLYVEFYVHCNTSYD